MFDEVKKVWLGCEFIRISKREKCKKANGRRLYSFPLMNDYAIISYLVISF